MLDQQAGQADMDCARMTLTNSDATAHSNDSLAISAYD